MYIPKQFLQENNQSSIETIKQIKFGALVIFAGGRFISSHLPFIVKEHNEKIILECHVSKANELWQVATPENKALVIFQGAHTYIHPNWYPTKNQTGKVVPTWNYQVIHCHGSAQSQESAKWLLQNVMELTDHNEKDQNHPWSVADAPKDYILSQLKGIVGIRFEVEKIESSLKMNQHHPKENRLGVIEGLAKSDNPHQCAVANIMRNLEQERK